MELGSLTEIHDKISCSWVKGFRISGGPKIAVSHKKAKSSTTLPLSATALAWDKRASHTLFIFI